MTYEELIDETLDDGLNVKGDDSFPYAQEADNRERARRRGQVVLNDFWMKTDWVWRRALTPAECTRDLGDESFLLPDDFSQAGEYMSVVNVATSLPVRRKDPQTVQMALDFGGNGRRVGRALIYCCVVTYDDTFGELNQMLAAPRAGQHEAVNVRGYLRKPPVFVDDDTEVPIPEKYHREVLLRLMKREFMKVVGDARDMQELQEIQTYIAQAVADENPKNYPKRAPRYGRRHIRGLA